MIGYLKGLLLINMKYIKKFKDDAIFVSDEQINPVIDLFQEIADKWGFKQVIEIISHSYSGPEDRIYRVIKVGDGSIYVHISYIVYDGVYTMDENPDDDIILYHNRLKKFGYKVDNIDNSFEYVKYSHQVHDAYLRRPEAEVRSFKVWVQ